MGFIERLQKRPWLHRLLVACGIRYLYRTVRKLVLFLKYGNVKKMDIQGVQVSYSTADEASKKFFHHKYWFGDLFEKNITLHMLHELKDARCFIDVGANMGFYSILIAKLTEGNGGSVHAVEMDQENLERLKRSVGLNKLANLKTYLFAAGDRDGSIEYYRRGSELNTLRVVNDEQHHEKTVVRMSTLDTFVRENGLEPDAIKIDVEGAEFLVLTGMRHILRKKDLKVYCEVHLHEGSGSLHAFGHTVEDIFSIFHVNGFRLKLLRLRSDSRHEEKEIGSAAEISESCMLFASKRTS